MVPSCTNDKSSICTTWIKWCRPVQTTRAVYVLHGLNGAVLYKQQELYMYYMDSMVPSCTNDKSCICTTWIQWCRPVQTTRQEPCTNNKSSICTTWIKWCRPVQMTRAVYVLHGLNGAVLYKQQELYMYYMDSMVPSCTNDKSSICTNNKSCIWCIDSMVPSCTNNKTWIKWCNGAVLYKRQELYMYYMD